MYHWTEYAQTNAQPRPLSDKKDFGICPLIPELEPREVHTLGLHHPVDWPKSKMCQKSHSICKNVSKNCQTSKMHLKCVKSPKILIRQLR